MRSLLLPAVLLLAACDTSPPGPPEAPSPATGDDAVTIDAAHNSRNALDWPGSYSGVLPCADCDGIQTTVTLRADGGYDRTLVYVGKSVETIRQSGEFSWNTAGSAVTLALPDGATQMYQVGEHQLFHLDETGNRISGDPGAQYILRQAMHDPRIEE